MIGGKILIGEQIKNNRLRVDLKSYPHIYKLFTLTPFGFSPSVYYDYYFHVAPYLRQQDPFLWW